MDTSKEYTLMCKAAEEIQESWNFNDGDYIFDPRDESVDVWAGYSASDYPGYPSKECAGGVWIPRQDQLQNMCLEEGEPFDPELLYVFINWIYSPLKKIKFSSLESAWLQYVMWTFYRKEWDGQKWI